MRPWCAIDGRRPPELLTLHEAADRLGVHYMTVYRHVRLGMLAARKVGGQWRIDPADLAAVGQPPAGRPARMAGEPRPATRDRPARRAPWADRLRGRMLAGDSAGSWQVVEAAMASGVEPADVYVEILGPALHAIGAAWARGEIGDRPGAPGQRRGNGDRRPHGVSLPPPRAPPRHVLVAMPVGERHGLGAAMLADILAQAGYEVLNLGTAHAARLAGHRRRSSRRRTSGHRQRRRSGAPARRSPAHRRRPSRRSGRARNGRWVRRPRRGHRDVHRGRRVGLRSASPRRAHRPAHDSPPSDPVVGTADGEAAGWAGSQAGRAAGGPGRLAAPARGTGFSPGRARCGRPPPRSGRSARHGSPAAPRARPSRASSCAPTA